MKKYMETQINGEKTNIISYFSGFQKCDAGHTFGPYIRNCFLLHYCVSGKGFFEIENGRFEVSAGDVFIICRDDVTTYRADDKNPWEYVWIAFDGSDAERLRDLPPVVNYAGDTFLKIKNAIAGGETDMLIFNSYLLEILYTVFDNKPQHDIFAQINNYIKYNYMEEITVESIAETVHLNRRYLSREFKKRYGVTICEKLICTRIEAASNFLMRGFSVGDAARMAGYKDQFNFSKMFKRVKGVSPSEYKSDSKRTRTP